MILDALIVLLAAAAFAFGWIARGDGIDDARRKAFAAGYARGRASRDRDPVA